MPPTRQPQDPFTDAPLRPTTSNAPSQQPHRTAAASAAPTRPRHQRDLFAPSLSRRPTSRATPRVEDGVLADSDSETELRKQRQGKPGGGVGRSEEQEFVNRQADGSFLLGVGAMGSVPQMSVPRTEEEVDQAEVDAHYVGISRQYFSSGAALGGRGSKKHEEELEQLRLPMMVRLREQVMQQLDEERWKYEPLDGFQAAGP